MNDLVGWLRREIEADKAAALKALPGPWRAEPYVYGKPEDGWGDPTNWEVLSTQGTVVSHQAYEGGGADGPDALHIARHDPQDVIARCDAELAILDEHEDIDGHCETCGNYDPTGLHEHSVAAPCRTVRLLAQGYRHRDGWQADWTA